MAVTTVRNAQKVESATKELEKCSTSTRRMVIKFNHIMELMQKNGWKGDSSTTFYQKATNYKSQLRSLQKQINEVATLAKSYSNFSSTITAEIEGGIK